MVTAPSAAKEIFFAALEKPTPADRATYLAAACGDDADLRRHVEALLAAHNEPDSRFDQATRDVDSMPDPLSTADSSDWIGTRIGPYKLRELLGEGGMGVVYVAEQTEPVRRKVALKIIKPGMDTRQVIARFEAERQALALMDHPNIARILDAGTTGEPATRIGEPGASAPGGAPPAHAWGSPGRPYFVMELVVGLPITEYCDQAQLTPRQRLEIFVTVCQAVQHAHQKGIIHRDLKPSNILVTLHDSAPVAKVIDFGVAKALTQARSASEGNPLRLTEKTLYTGVAQLIGTPLYMSPEQAEMSGLDVDTRSDVYSLGVVLYELLTGTTPFDKETLSKAGLDEMRRIIREVEPETVSLRLAKTRADKPGVDAGAKLSRRAHAVLAELDWVVMKALEKDRNHRYESASALAADIQRYLADEPVLACPPSAAYRFRKFARRNKATITTTALVAAALVIGTIVSTGQAIRARQAENAANANLARAVAEEQRAIKAAEAEVAQRLLAEASQRQSEASEAAAKKSAAEARSVLSFFQDKVLAAARPTGKLGGLGIDTTIRQAIDAAEAAVSTSFADQPLVEASVRHVLGSNYHLLGDYKLAVAQLERAWELRKAELGEGHRDTLTSMVHLASSCKRAGFRDRVLPLKLQAYELSKKHLGLEDTRTLGEMHDLAGDYFETGKLDLALPLFEQVLDLSKAKDGYDDFLTLTCMVNLGKVYSQTGRLDLAQELTQQAVERLLNKFGPTHVDTLGGLETLASVYRRSDQPELAIQTLRTVVDGREKVLPPGHPGTLSSMTNLAAAYYVVKDYANAELWYRRSLELHEKHLGMEHPQTRAALAKLALIVLAQNKYSEAEPLLRKALSEFQRLQPDLSKSSQLKSQLAGAVLSQLREQPRTDPAHARLAEAETLLLSAHEALTAGAAQNSDPSREAEVSQIVERLVQLYQLWNKPDQAAQWQARLDALAAQQPK